MKGTREHDFTEKQNLHYGPDKDENKTKVIRADLMDLDFNLDLDFEDFFGFCNISVMVKFQFW